MLLCPWCAGACLSGRERAWQAVCNSAASHSSLTVPHASCSFLDRDGSLDQPG